MPSELHTTTLRLLQDRLERGDALALDELLRRAASRMERLARSMLRRFPRVRLHEQTGDVIQEASFSLSTALRQLRFTSTRDFYGLAAEHIRRRLLDLARRHGRAERDPLPLDETIAQVPSSETGDDLERWSDLHEVVALLPGEQREVFGLRFYHGWGVQEIAELFQVSTKTVDRRWSSALMRLQDLLGGRSLPGEDEPD